MAATSLAQLLVTPTQQAIYQKLLGQLQGAGFPTTDWHDGGPEKTLVAVFAEGLVDFAANLIPVIVGGVLVDSSSGAWLDLLAQQGYQLPRNAALSTIGTEVLFCAAGAGPYTLTAGQLWFLAASGNRYVSTSGGTLRPPGFSSVAHVGAGTGTVTLSGTNAGGVSFVITITAGGTIGGGASFSYTTSGGYPVAGTTPGAQFPSQSIASQTIPGGGIYTDPLTGITFTFGGPFSINDTYSGQSYGCLPVTVQSEAANNSAAGLNYIDGVGTLTQMITPLPGITCNNPGTMFSTPLLTGQGTGTVSATPTAAATPVSARSVLVRIDSTGQVGAATWSYSIDGGASWTSAGTASFVDIAGNIRITLTNAPVANPSFYVYDSFAFTSPGSWVSQQGTDVELDAALRTRCKGRWPLLSMAPTLSAYQALALNASAQVTQALVITDTVVPGQVDIFISGQAGPLPAATVNAVLAYIKARVPQTDSPVVQSVTGQSITLGGTITYRAAAGLAIVQAAVQAAVQNYLGAVGIGGTPNAGVVRLAGIIDAIMNVPGVVDVASLMINSFGTNYSLPSYSSGAPPTPPSVATIGVVAGMFTWTGI